MTPSETAELRLAAQGLDRVEARTCAEAVASLGAMQAQDHAGALWSAGVRSPGATEAGVERAIAGRAIVRTWLLRGTLHLAAAEDVRWMLALVAPRNLEASERRRRELELDDATIKRCRRVAKAVLRGGVACERDVLLAKIEAAGVRTGQQRSYHLLWRLAMEGLICFAGREGKQPAFALLEEWVPAGKRLSRDEARVELARRYFASHGPATLADYAGWCGLPMAEVRQGMEGAAPDLAHECIDGDEHWFARNGGPTRGNRLSAHLLSGFDEYILGYKERRAVLDARYAERICPGGNGVFLPTILIGGRVRGTWKRTLRTRGVTIELAPFDPLKRAERPAVEAAAQAYGAFLGLPMRLD